MSYAIIPKQSILQKWIKQFLAWLFRESNFCLGQPASRSEIAMYGGCTQPKNGHTVAVVRALPKLTKSRHKYFLMLSLFLKLSAILRPSYFEVVLMLRSSSFWGCLHFWVHLQFLGHPHFKVIFIFKLSSFLGHLHFCIATVTITVTVRTPLVEVNQAIRQ